MDFGSRARKTAQNYVAYSAQNGMGFTQSSSEPRSDGEEPGTCTLPSWKTTSPPSDLSPKSRTRAIAQGQMELMEMVRNMPESHYELSLRDLVEKPAKSQDDGASGERRNDDPIEEKAFNRSESRKKTQHGGQSYLNGKAQMERSGSIDSGRFLLKMVFPASSLGSKQKQRSSSSLTPNSSSKVSPRPSLSEEAVKGLDREWWKKLSASGKVKHGILEIDSGNVKSIGSSSNCSNNGKNRREGVSVGCCPFSRKKKGALPR